MSLTRFSQRIDSGRLRVVLHKRPEKQGVPSYEDEVSRRSGYSYWVCKRQERGCRCAILHGCSPQQYRQWEQSIQRRLKLGAVKESKSKMGSCSTCLLHSTPGGSTHVVNIGDNDSLIKNDLTMFLPAMAVNIHSVQGRTLPSACKAIGKNKEVMRLLGLHRIS